MAEAPMVEAPMVEAPMGETPMGEAASLPLQDRMEKATRGKIFFLILLAIQFVPAYSSQNWSLGAFWELDRLSSMYAWVYQPEAVALYPIIKALSLAAILGLFILRNRFAKVFSTFVGISFLWYFSVQLIGIGHDRYGLIFHTAGFLLFAMVAATWFWEAGKGLSDFSRIQATWTRYWVVPAAVFAFWLPQGPQGLPDFSPSLFFTSAGGTAFCMMTPVYLAILILFFPKVNVVTLRITALVGLMMGLYQMLFTFVMNFSGAWWGGVLHLPLVAISTYALVLAYGKQVRG